MTLKEILSGKVKTAVKIENQEQFIEIDKIYKKYRGLFIAFMFFRRKISFLLCLHRKQISITVTRRRGH